LRSDRASGVGLRGPGLLRCILGLYVLRPTIFPVSLGLDQGSAPAVLLYLDMAMTVHRSLWEGSEYTETPVATH